MKGMIGGYCCISRKKLQHKNFLYKHMQPPSWIAPRSSPRRSQTPQVIRDSSGGVSLKFGI